MDKELYLSTYQESQNPTEFCFEERYSDASYFKDNKSELLSLDLFDPTDEEVK